MMRSFVVSVATFAFVFATPISSTIADWPQFRGPNSSGIADGPAAPIEFGPGKQELWSIPLQSGHSSPCIVGDAIYLTTFNQESKKLAVVKIASSDGAVQWEREVPTDKIEKGHPSFNPASSSPASDGDRVVAYFGSFGLICFDKDGDKQWDIKMPLTKSYAGNATSPTIVGDRVILYRGNHVDHFLLCVNKKTGEEIWKIQQDERFESELACTACPIVSGDKLIVHSARALQAIDIQSGKQIWVVKCNTTATSTPVIAGNEVVVAAWNKMGEPSLRPEFPTFEKLVEQNDKDKDQLISKDELPRIMIFHRPEGAEAPQNGAPFSFGYADKNRNGRISKEEWDSRVAELEAFRARYDTHGMLAIPIESKGHVEIEKVRTLAKQGIPEVPSPLYHDGHLFFVKNGGVLTTIDLETGKRTARVRTKGRGTHYASPIASNGNLYCAAGNGTISVIQLGPKPKTLAVNKMDDATYATPAIADGVLYVRTHSKLYAFGSK